MTSLAKAHGRFDSTSADGAMLNPRMSECIVGLMLVDFGTSIQCVLPAEAAFHLPLPVRQTTSGLSLPKTQRPGASITELRRLSGFSWEQLARLFGVSRRSLHFWASGKAMTPANEEHLQRLLAIVRKIDRGSASANRALLLGARDDGTVPFDLLAEGQYERLVSLLGRGGAISRLTPAPLSEAAKAARAPRPPGELLSALQDRIHEEEGIGRGARSVKVRSGRDQRQLNLPVDDN